MSTKNFSIMNIWKMLKKYCENKIFKTLKTLSNCCAKANH